MNKERYTGSLMGLAIGDALGAPIEFQQYGKFEPIKDFQGGGMFKLNPGEFTDDTSLALCLSESLISLPLVPCSFLWLSLSVIDNKLLVVTTELFDKLYNLSFPSQKSTILIHIMLSKNFW